MVRAELDLADEQMARLEEMARDRQTDVQELIRAAVEDLLRVPAEPTRAEKRRRAAAVSGRFHFGVSDLAENHDAYLDEAS